jgi:hypothetical protein
MTYRKYITIVEAANKGCPIATYDIDINLKNRQKAIDDYHYGPANPDKPGSYWKDAAKVWSIDGKTAQTMRCGNCSAFDVSDKMWKCIEDGIKGTEASVDGLASIHKADLGYCNFLHFKCAGTRSCKAWIHGGSIDNKDRTK